MKIEGEATRIEPHHFLFKIFLRISRKIYLEDESHIYLS
jgi:hypothetical protein